MIDPDVQVKLVPVIWEFSGKVIAVRVDHDKPIFIRGFARNAYRKLSGSLVADINFPDAISNDISFCAGIFFCQRRQDVIASCQCRVDGFKLKIICVFSIEVNLHLMIFAGTDSDLIQAYGHIPVRNLDSCFIKIAGQRV